MPIRISNISCGYCRATSHGYQFHLHVQYVLAGSALQVVDEVFGKFIASPHGQRADRTLRVIGIHTDKSKPVPYRAARSLTQVRKKASSDCAALVPSKARNACSVCARTSTSVSSAALLSCKVPGAFCNVLFELVADFLQTRHKTGCVRPPRQPVTAWLPKPHP